MRLLTRYIVWELFKVFTLTLIVLTTTMMLAVVVQEAIREGLDFEPIIRLIPYVLPNALRFAVPGTMLFAVCSVYGRMSSDSEIVAIKASGVSPMAAVMPALVLGALISPAAVWLNDVAVSWGRKGMHRVVLQSVEQIAYGMLKKKRLYATEKFSISVQRVDGKKLLFPIMSFDTPKGRATFTAEEAEMRLVPEKNVLKVSMTNCEAELDGGRGIFDQLRFDVPLAQASRRGSLTSDRPSVMPLARIGTAKDKQRKAIESAETKLAARAAYQLMMGEWGELSEETWSKRRALLQHDVSRLHRLNTEPWRRWAVGFSCFFFVLVGAPLAIRLRHADFWMTFLLCYLPILFVYYPLLAFGVDQAKNGSLPPYTVWVGNATFALIGLFLINRMTRR